MTVLEVLMKRDNLTEREARALVRECAIDAIQDVLGLEDDFIYDVLDEGRSVIVC